MTTLPNYSLCTNPVFTEGNQRCNSWEYQNVMTRQYLFFGLQSFLLRSFACHPALKDHVKTLIRYSIFALCKNNVQFLNMTLERNELGQTAISTFHYLRAGSRTAKKYGKISDIIFKNKLKQFHHVLKKKLSKMRGQPSKYYPRPTGFDFGHLKGSRFFPCGLIVDKRPL